MDLLRRRNYASGAPMEETLGYSRAVRIGNQVFVGGTTSTTPEGVVEGEGDAYRQSRIVLEKIEQALHRAGARVDEVYRVRIYLTDIKKAGDVMKAYSEFFKPVAPVITVAEVSALARPAHIVEIEAEAVIGSYRVAGE